MSFARGMCASLAVLALVGCASREDLAVVQRDQEEMKSRLFTVNKDLNQIQNQVKEGVEKSLVGYKQSLEGLQKEVQGYQKDMASLRKEGADLQATLDSARVDMQLLTGKVDDVRIMAQKPAEDLQLLKDDVGKRLAALDERLAKLEKGMAEQQKRAEEALQTPEHLYQQGVDALRGGDAAKSRDSLNSFLERYPQHDLVPNVHYWLGEGYLTEKNYEQAILEFQEVIKNPKSEKTAAALLKQGTAFRELGDVKSANYDFKRVIEEYPKSEEAMLAKEKLQKK